LGGEETSLMIDDIIHPGYERIIEGQGMPSTKEQGGKGNLRVVFLVEFPTQLTDEQRSDIRTIFEDSS
jgi:DnaJ family protein B protein 13